MPTVRTTMRPDQPIEVGDVEYADLKAQGLLIEEPAPTPAVPPAAAPPAPAKKASGASGSKES